MKSCALIRILRDPKNALCRQYQELFGMENAELEFTEGALKAIADKYGARIKVAEIPPGPPVISTLVAEVYGPDDASRAGIAARVALYSGSISCRNVFSGRSKQTATASGFRWATSFRSIVAKPYVAFVGRPSGAVRGRIAWNAR